MSTDTCTPATHFHNNGRCVYCGQPPATKPPRPRCPHCCGTGTESMTWLGPPGHHWRFNDCGACGGTGRPQIAADGGAE